MSINVQPYRCSPYSLAKAGSIRDGGALKGLFPVMVPDMLEGVMVVSRARSDGAEDAGTGCTLAEKEVAPAFSRLTFDTGVVAHCRYLYLHVAVGTFDGGQERGRQSCHCCYHRTFLVAYSFYSSLGWFSERREHADKRSSRGGGSIRPRVS